MSKKAIRLTKSLAFYIVGPESAGNRLMARSLHSSGVANVYTTKGGVYQPAPHRINYSDDPLVISMSIPYNFRWPDISRQYLDIRYDKDYNQIRNRIVWMILDRDTVFMVKSQVKQKRVRGSGEAYRNIKRARAEISIAVNYLDFLDTEIVRVQYETFVTDRWYRKNLFSSFGLPEPTIKYYNANEGHV